MGKTTKPLVPLVQSQRGMDISWQIRDLHGPLHLLCPSPPEVTICGR